MIGKLYSSTMSFFDLKTNKNAFKNRPVLIIGDIRNNDYTVLPVSTISISSNIDTEYDIKIDPAKYPALNLRKISYIRTHKALTIHRAELYKEISDLKALEPDLFTQIMLKYEQWTKEIIAKARL